MAELISIDEVKFASSPSSASEVLDRGIAFCEELEKGNILFFKKIPFEFSKEDIDFLLSQKQTGAKNRKNIAFKPNSEKITNFIKASSKEQQKLLEIMRSFSNSASIFLSKLLTPYAAGLRMDYASFRPFQEEGRKLRLRARNDLLHVDAFPTRPMNGTRILRFFININPKESRKWITSDPFEHLAKRFAGTKKMPFPKAAHTFSQKLSRLMKRGAKWAGFPSTLRSPYDSFMLRFHHFLKENEEFQKNCDKDHWEFPPFSCWIVFTDQVSHAALKGQYALEQTFLVPKSSLLNPEKAPISILESLSGEIMK